MIDDVDRKILRALQFDARISNVSLAEKVGLSATPCWNRVRALEAKGVIEGYVTIIQHAALGYPVTVIVEVGLERHNDAAFEQFEAELTKLTEVIEAHRVTGEYDYLLKVAVAGAEGCERFLRQRLHAISGIRGSRASFVLKPLKLPHFLHLGDPNLTGPKVDSKEKRARDDQGSM